MSCRYRGITLDEYLASEKDSLASQPSEHVEDASLFTRFLMLLNELSEGTILNPLTQQAERFSFLALVPTEENWPIQSDLPPESRQWKLTAEDETLYINYMRLQAKWFQSQFRKMLIKIVDDLNFNAEKCEAATLGSDYMKHIAALGVDPEVYSLRVSSASVLQKLDQPGSVVFAGKISGVVFAPVKDFERCLAKSLKYHRADWLQTVPAARAICDFLRATIYAQDPYVLSLAYAMLKNRSDGIPRVSNYYIGHEHMPLEKQTFINTNILLVDPETEVEHFAEVQFALQDFLTMKGIQHEYYEITRAESASEVLARPFSDSMRVSRKID